MAVIFDGKKISQEIKEELKEGVENFRDKDITPKLVSIIVGDDPASKLYVNLKKKAAEEVGCQLSVVSFSSSVKKNLIIKKINEFNEDESVHGIMVQLPLPENFSELDRDQIIGAISPEKDVDGLRDDSNFITPAVKAVLIAIKEGGKFLPSDKPAKAVVVGAKGFEGSKIVKVLEEMGYDVKGLDTETKELGPITKKADILISSTGDAGLIKKDMVKEGAVVIDVGSPKGDVEDNVKEVASLITPVPGGIGPLTVVCLLENLVQAASSYN